MTTDDGRWTAPAQAQRSSLGTVVIATLVDQIVSGALQVGTILPSEAELGEQLGVSRTVIRESVKSLQSKGLLSSRQGVGTVVRAMDSWDLIDEVVLSAMVKYDESLGILDDLVSVRAALEMAMAEEACRGQQAADLSTLRLAYEEMTESSNDAPAFARADIRFHDAVMTLSGNRLGRAIVTSIHDQARTTGRYHGSATQANIDITLAEHRAILDALEHRDGARAGLAMRAHILGSWERRRPVAADSRGTSAAD
jgi:DNA-binding FadR family transcriptional regulator